MISLLILTAYFAGGAVAAYLVARDWFARFGRDEDFADLMALGFCMFAALLTWPVVGAILGIALLGRRFAR